MPEHERRARLIDTLEVGVGRAVRGLEREHRRA